MMDLLKAYAAAIIGTFVMIAGPFLAAIAVATFQPALGAPALGLGLVIFPVIGCYLCVELF